MGILCSVQYTATHQRGGWRRLIRMQGTRETLTALLSLGIYTTDLHRLELWYPSGCKFMRNVLPPDPHVRYGTIINREGRYPK